MNLKVIAASSLLAILLAVVLLVPLFVGGGSTAYSAYDDSWRGTGAAREHLARLDGASFEIRNVGTSPLLLEDTDASATLLVVVAVERPYTPAERDALDSFLDDGGKVLVLDDYGYASDFTLAHGIGYQKRPLLDESFDRNQSFIQTQATIGGSTYSVAMNAPVALADIESTGLHAFMRSSATSYLDLNDDGKIDVGDKLGPFNVGIRAPVGPHGGELVVVSDSGPLLNDMLDRAHNRQFLEAFVMDALPEGGLVLFDETRRDAVGMEGGIYAAENSLLSLLRRLPVVGAVFTAALLGLVGIFMFLLPGREPWVHRFRPGVYVAPPRRASLRGLLIDVLEIQKTMHHDGAAITDPVLRQALANPEAVQEKDIPMVLRRVAAELELDIPDLDDDTPSPPDDGAAGKSAPVPAARPGARLPTP